MLGGSNPPTACFSPTPSRSGEKDTLRNIRETREYVINLVDGEMLHGMNATSALLPPNESEWELTEFEPMPGLKVGPAWIKNTPAAFEMNLIEVVEVGTGPGASRFVIGEIVALHVRQDLLVDAPNEDGGAQLHPGAGKMIARLGENGYIDLANCPSFDLHRPH